ncbi:HD domain-containing protein [Paraglaciecola polaris]|uniref:Two-component regulator with metal-dependent phosphohydrolase, HD region n=1 Tax=Paraglaciecola polaris LMG 21857 TaxID=1129793 RepID=K7A984_9ALTE|nr:HD domain-containing protein [Paraglaciecola polaris]GAC31985.1 two-component regulator with metal-dependent phosphohydrolase, HD region [Paraglaciecola polaris LMG 21857]
MDAFVVKMAEFIKVEMVTDLAHDFEHVRRVVRNATQLCSAEKANEWVVMPAVWLHDCLTLAKDHPKRSSSSIMAADKALVFLAKIDYPAEHFDHIHHAIVAHSYSADITPKSLEACVVQDADRLDAIGAVGIARCLQVGSALQRRLYEPDDPFALYREVDDAQFTLDHFYQKLLKIEETMHTDEAKREARIRTDFMHHFIRQIRQEINF